MQDLKCICHAASFASFSNIIGWIPIPGMEVTLYHWPFRLPFSISSIFRLF